MILFLFGERSKHANQSEKLRSICVDSMIRIAVGEVLHVKFSSLPVKQQTASNMRQSFRLPFVNFTRLCKCTMKFMKRSHFRILTETSNRMNLHN